MQEDNRKVLAEIAPKDAEKNDDSEVLKNINEFLQLAGLK